MTIKSWFMNLKILLTQVKLQTDQKLTEFFKGKHMEAESIHPYLVHPIDKIRDFTMRGGKRTRPALCVLGYVASQKLNPNDVDTFIENIPVDLMNLMLASELFQSFCLIHDDIMDQDNIRRGGPTVHSFFRDEYKTKFPHVSDVHKADNFGESIGILTGDLVITWAEDLINVLDRIEVQKIYQKAKQEVIFGQLLDVANSSGMAEITQIQINELKTAWYSMIRPLQLGAQLAGGDQKLIDNLAIFGKPVGLLYQLKDDLMDKEITDTEFNIQSEILVTQVHTELYRLGLTDAINKIFLELIEFVVNRSA
jgi:geranylgeranyl diphosphate synthase, type I